MYLCCWLLAVRLVTSNDVVTADHDTNCGQTKTVTTNPSMMMMRMMMMMMMMVTVRMQIGMLQQHVLQPRHSVSVLVSWHYDVQTKRAYPLTVVVECHPSRVVPVWATIAWYTHPKTIPMALAERRMTHIGNFGRASARDVHPQPGTFCFFQFTIHIKSLP